MKQWHAEHDPPLGKEPMHDDTVYRGHDWDDMRPHLNVFFQSVKSRKPVTEDAVFGNHAAIACHMANESYFRQKPVTWDAASKTIKSTYQAREEHASDSFAGQNRKIIPVLLGFLVLSVCAHVRRICPPASRNRSGCLRNDWSASAPPCNTTSTTSALRAQSRW